MLRGLLHAMAHLRPRDDERGQGLTEYALLLAGIVVVVAAAVLVLGNEISNIIDSIF
jgi:Flp pilus assembly pilin Flp